QIRQTVTRVTANGENVVTRVQSPGNKVQPGRRCRPEWVTRTGRGVGNRLQRLAPHRRSARSRPHARNRPPGRARPEPKRVMGADRRGRSHRPGSRALSPKPTAGPGAELLRPQPGAGPGAERTARTAERTARTAEHTARTAERSARSRPHRPARTRTPRGR